jgi:hypothetical protein
VSTGLLSNLTETDRDTIFADELGGNSEISPLAERHSRG